MPRGAQAAAHPVRPKKIIKYSSSSSSSSSSSISSSNVIIIIVLVLIIFSSSSRAGAQEDHHDQDESQALIKFKTSLENADPALADWSPSRGPPCSGNNANWVGVLCFNGYVWGLQLENMNLKGQIDVNSLAPLRFLRTLSFMGNSFEGTMPDWKRIGALKSLFLSNNHFSGEMPADAFRAMTSLKKVHMANNKFTGHIPTSLESPKLIELRLENNQFTGTIPKISSENLKILNVSNNQLEGPIPPDLTNMDPTSFTGNKALCGKPLQVECEPNVNPPTDLDPSSNPPTDLDPSRATTPPPIALIVVCVVLGFFLILLLVLLINRGRSLRNQTPKLGRAVSPPADGETTLNAAGGAVAGGSQVLPGETTLSGGGGGGKGGNPTKNKSEQQQPGKLSFVREDRQKFDLQDLMRASAEVLGSGNFGASYKAVLVDGEALVVKRFKKMNNIAREDFHEHMRRLGRLKHPNLLPLVAYLYRKEEKLLVFDFVPNGSLATRLHGKHSAELPVLSWPTRLKIIKGVTKGLLYLQNEVPTLTVPHGHLKSSNVLLDRDFNPLLMDYALFPVVNSNQVHQILLAYKSPEYAQQGRISKKTDVWCLGTLVLETLTGKYLAQGSNADLAEWINGIAGEEYAKVFDNEMEISTESSSSRSQMEKLLQIGIACCQEDPDKRWDLEEALHQIEQIHPDHNEDHDHLLSIP